MASEGTHGQSHELHGIVICCSPIRTDLAAASAPVYNCPFSIFPDPYAHGVHTSAAVCLPVSGFHVQMQTAKTVWAMITVVAPCTGRYDEPAAYFTGKTIVAPMCFIVSFFMLFSFVLSVHNCSLLCGAGRTTNLHAGTFLISPGMFVRTINIFLVHRLSMRPIFYLQFEIVGGFFRK